MSDKVYIAIKGNDRDGHIVKIADDLTILIHYLKEYYGLDGFQIYNSEQVSVIDVSENVEEE